MFRKILYILLFGFYCSSLWANLNDRNLISNNSLTNNFLTQGHTHNKMNYLITSSSVMFVGMLAGVGVLYLGPENISGWDKKELRGGQIFKRWRENVSKGPVIDQDKWYLNWVTHPYWGAIYYMQARNAGYEPFGSFLWAVTLSTFWEYGIEAFAEVPSTQDLIITPVVGSLLGEVFYKTSNHLKEKLVPGQASNYLIYPLLFLMDPISIFIEHSFLHNYVVADNNLKTMYYVGDDKFKVLFLFQLK